MSLKKPLSARFVSIWAFFCGMVFLQAEFCCDIMKKRRNKAIEEEIKYFPIFLYGDNVFEKDGIRRDRTGDGEKTRCLCGKRGIFNRDGPAMGPQIIRQLE